jgi:hypothetical protein
MDDREFDDWAYIPPFYRLVKVVFDFLGIPV